MNCLLIRPRWMWEERDVIGNVPLHSLMLPGTHNSGSFIPNGSRVRENIIDRELSYNTRINIKEQL